MNKKFIKVAFVAAIVMVGGVNVFNAQKVNTLSDVVLANVEALADDENMIDCPDPYDVKNHQLNFTQRTGEFTVDSGGEITIMGKKYAVGGASAGMYITLTYELGNCDMESTGNCCPGSRIGEIRIVGLS